MLLSRIKKYLLLLLLLTTTMLVNPAVVSAKWSPHCTAPGDPTIPTIKGLECLFEQILSIALTFIGIGVFAMLVAGSFQLLMSGGDPQKAERAKATIGMAVAGLATALGVWFLFRFIAIFTGASSILNFSIGF